MAHTLQPQLLFGHVSDGGTFVVAWVALVMALQVAVSNSACQAAVSWL